MPDIILKEEAYNIVGICMEVHKLLGIGFLEIVYKDAMEFELNKKQIQYKREKEYKVIYKDHILPHKFYADFIIYNSIILELKHAEGIADEFIAQAINYLRVSENKLLPYSKLRSQKSSIQKNSIINTISQFKNSC